MKLYLSSYRLGADPEPFRALVGGRGRAAVVFNALDAYGPRRLEHRAREMGDLRALGLSCEELDLRAYFDDFDGLRRRVEACAVVFAVGGNAFVLARAMTASRFREAIDEPLARGQLVYAGYSAGACVAGPDLVGCHLMDEQDAVARGYPADAAPNTLGLVPWRVVPHFRSDHAESAAAECAYAYLDEEGLAYRALEDGQAIVVCGDNERLVTASPGHRHRA